jgi:hypothetical protein
MKIITTTTPTVVAQARRLQQRLHIHGGKHQPSVAILNPSTSPTARPATPTFCDYAPSTAHDDVRLAPTPTAPQPPPFSPLDVHTHHPPHLASPQTPHLAPSPLPAPAAPKRTRPDSPPTASPPPQDALRTDAASAESLKAHHATESETNKPRHQDAHCEHALTDHTLASNGHLARPANWDSMSRKAKKNWKQMQARIRGTKQS